MLGAQGGEDLGEHLGGFALGHALGFGGAVAQAAQFGAGGAVLPVGEQAEIVQTVGQGHGGDVPNPLAVEDLVDVRARGHVAEHADAGHEEGGGEVVGLPFGLGAGAGVLAAVQDEVAQFVGGVETAAFGGLAPRRSDRP